MKKVIAVVVGILIVAMLPFSGGCDKVTTGEKAPEPADAREVHYEILREFAPYEAANSLGLELLVGTDISKVEIITLIRKLSKGKDPVQINMYTDRKAYEDSENSIYGEAFDEHFLLFYVKNYTIQKIYYGLNEIRWMQSKGKFKDLFGSKTRLQ